jgi:hypothetical protein
MIQRITYDRSVELHKVKLDVNKLNTACDELDKDKEIYYIGIDFAPKGSKDKSFLIANKKLGDGKYQFVRYEEISN